MRIINYTDLDESFFDYKEYEEVESVKQYISEVKKNGDQALKDISAKFGEHIDNIEISKEEIEKRVSEVSKDSIYYLKKSIKNVRYFAEKQMESLKPFEYNCSGSRLGHKIIPLERIGAYVPGGRYPLPSSAIMTVLPAKVAGVKEVIMCSPKIKNETVAAAYLSGVDRIFNIGGAQAIAAMAYGTETVPQVDKIVGPGNKFVTQAKKEIYGKCGIDFLAGPSEIMIISDETAIESFIAADILSQAEHDTDATAILIT
ncbi:MAG: histidinol dehydrogenase, partial [Cyanobacteriota bacterium]